MDNININNNVDTDLQEQGQSEKANNVNNEVPEVKTEKTFTQEQLDDIIEKRLTKERKRLRGMIEDDEAIKAELLRNKLQLSTTKKLTEEGYPISLAELMDYSSDENCNNSYNKVVEVFNEALQKKISERFKSYGRTPQQSGNNIHNTDGLRSVFGLKRGD